MILRLLGAWGDPLTQLHHRMAQQEQKVEEEQEEEKEEQEDEEKEEQEEKEEKDEQDHEGEQEEEEKDFNPLSSNRALEMSDMVEELRNGVERVAEKVMCS